MNPKTTSNPDRSIHNTDRNFRIFGIIIIILGATMLWFFMYRPIEMAQSGVEDITLHKRSALTGLFVTCFGPFFLIFGKKSIEIIPTGNTDLKKISWKYWITVIILVSISIYIWSWFEGTLEDLGYKLDQR